MPKPRSRTARFRNGSVSEPETPSGPLATPSPPTPLYPWTLELTSPLNVTGTTRNVGIGARPVSASKRIALFLFYTGGNKKTTKSWFYLFSTFFPRVTGCVGVGLLFSFFREMCLALHWQWGYNIDMGGRRRYASRTQLGGRWKGGLLSVTKTILDK